VVIEPSNPTSHPFGIRGHHDAATPKAPPMGEQPGVTPDHMRVASELLMRAHRRMQTRFEDVEAVLSLLLENGFAPRSSAAELQACFADFQAGAAATVAALRSLAEKLRQAAESLESADLQERRG
jgi:uncharacterized protein YukE